MRFLLIVILIFLQSCFLFAKDSIVVGSKKFTESVVLAEIAKLALREENIPTIHKAELGGTRILWNALVAGDIDIYAEYTGTLFEELLRKKFSNHSDLIEELRKYGIGATVPLGFNNTYAVGMKRMSAEQKQISKISDLVFHPNIKIGWGEEFRRRKDGWPGLKKRYQLPHNPNRGLDHDIAYRAIQAGNIDITDLYSTDAEIEYYDLKILDDDLNYFPEYQAIFLYRLDSAERFPILASTLNKFGGKISNTTMIELNRKAKIDKTPSVVVASHFLKTEYNQIVNLKLSSQAERIWTRSIEHIKLVFISLLIAIFVAVPLGVLAAKKDHVGNFILWFVGAIQTIPALALLVILIKPLNSLGFSGIGNPPAYVALVLYSLLPIIRSTHAGFKNISGSLLEIAEVLNLSFYTKLFRIEFPIALRSVFSGIKTSAVLNVGFATLGSIVGAGGYGQSILTGIRLDDYSLILEGAIPAAILALAVQLFFDFIENKVLPGNT